MDSIVDIAKNLLYQKNNFGDIYKGYFNNEIQETAISVVTDDIHVEETKFITILVENFNSILSDLFYIEEELDYIEDYEEVSIEKDFSDSHEVKEIGDTLFIRCIHPYRINNNSIRIIKKLKKKNSVDNSLIIVFRELKDIEKHILNGKFNRVKIVNSLEEIKDILIDFKSYYNEKIFIESKLVYKEKQVLDTNLMEDSFKIVVAIKFINTLSAEEIQQQDIYGFLGEKYTKIKQDYEKLAKEIVDKYLSSNFTGNYLVINSLLTSLSRVEKGLYDYIVTKFSIKFAEIIKIQEKGNRYLALMDSGLLYLDIFLTNEIKKLSEELNSFAWEE